MAPISRNEHILLVDDNSRGLLARKMVLEERGYTVTTACSVGDALELLAARQFDLIITDYRRPKLDGIELIRALRQHGCCTPVILISGFVEPLGLTETTTGADVLIQKGSHEVDHLKRSVERLLRRKPAPKKPAASQSGSKTTRQTSVR